MNFFSGYMKLSLVFSGFVSKKLPFTHPPEPSKEFLISSPTSSVYLGKTKFFSLPVFWDFKKLINPHIVIVGISGSGKSYLVKTFISRAAYIWKTNTVILDWTGEYVNWVKHAGGKIINAAEEQLNIFELSGSLPEERIKQILSAFDILLNLKEYPYEREVIETALEKLYTTSNHTLENFLLLLENEPKAKRLVKRLFLTHKTFSTQKSSININSLISSGLICIDLHSLPTEDLRSLFGLTILQFIKELMRKEKIDENKGIKLFVVLDEAWKIAKDSNSDVITIIREGRKYNFSIILASQNPTDINPIIFSNAGTIFIFRIVLKEYRDYLKSSLNFSSFIENEITRFNVGQAALHLIFKEKQPKFNTFIISKIEGEIPILFYSLVGDDMEIEIEREQFLKLLKEFGLNPKQIEEIKQEFEKNDGSMNGVLFVSLLEKFGFVKTNIITLLRKLGVDEKQIILLFQHLKSSRVNDKLTDIILEE